MKPTAINWLVEQLKINNYISDNAHWLIDEAKEMEKEQQGYSEEDLEKAFKVGFTLGYVGDTLIADKDKCFNRWFKIFKNK
jgi:hypothetical protein